MAIAVVTKHAFLSFSLEKKGMKSEEEPSHAPEHRGGYKERVGKVQWSPPFGLKRDKGEKELIK